MWLKCGVYRAGTDAVHCTLSRSALYSQLSNTYGLAWRGVRARACRARARACRERAREFRPDVRRFSSPLLLMWLGVVMIRGA